MRAAAADIEDDMRERRCLVSGEVLAEDRLVRFAADPDGNVVPDVAAVLPGRGMWVRADRDAVLGERELRLISPTGVSAATPLAMRVRARRPARASSSP